MSFFFRQILRLILPLLPAICLAGPIIETTWSPRIIPEFESNPEIREGGFRVTISSPVTIKLAFPVEDLRETDNNTWQYDFPWDWEAPLVAAFTDSLSDTTRVSITPEIVVSPDPAIHDLPVINIVTDAANLWDPETGIYVFGNHDNFLQKGDEWERPAAVQWYEGNLAPVFSEQIGIRIHGAYSRFFAQKGLRFYFDDYGTSNQIEYDFFGSQPISFRRLIIRTGHFPLHCINSVMLEDLFLDLGNMGSRHQDVAVYLNLEYWGFYTLRERIDEEFIEHTHGWNTEPYDFIKDGVTEHGDASSWWDFLDSLSQDNPFSSHAWYEEACATLDMKSYIDWQLLNIFGASADNNGPWNLVILRLGSNPWQFVMWDEDQIFKSENLEANYFRFRSVTTPEEYDEFEPNTVFSSDLDTMLKWGNLFAKLMENSEFKALLRQRYEFMYHGMMSEDALVQRLNEIRTSQSSEMDRHAERWNGPSYDSYANFVESWICQRVEINHGHYLDFIELHRHQMELVSFTGTQQSDGVHLSWQTDSEQKVAGFKLYRGTHPEDLSLVATHETEPGLVAIGDIWETANYVFVDSTTTGEFPLFYQLYWTDETGFDEEIPWTVEIPEVPIISSLKINEFLALNSTGLQDETGTREDWCEIFNAGNEPVQLGPLFLTDDLQYPTKWAFPDTTLPPGNFILVWCDSDPEDGPLHTNFKLNASGESLGIFNSLTNGNGLIHSRVFGVQESDTSEGLCIDGGDQYCSFSTPTPGVSNATISAVGNIPTSGLYEISCSPNPFNPSTTISFTIGGSTSVSVAIYDLKGQLVKQLFDRGHLPQGRHSIIWEGNNSAGEHLASGTYLAQIKTSGHAQTIKVLLVK